MALCIRVGLAAGLIAAALAPQAHAATQNQWVQYGPNNTVLLRSVSTTDAACPAASIDGTAVTLSPRFTALQDSTATAGAFSTGANAVLMCEASLPINYSQVTATIDGVPHKMPVANPKRVLVIGDTGCRLTATASQGCNDPIQFPLSFLSNYAAIFKPDLIVHDGDFYYREAACVTGDNACVGSPFGDNWQAWNADWFAPAKAMIASAPLALTRGNHESCGRGAKGWFSLLAVQPYDPAQAGCTGPTSKPTAQPLTANDYTAPYAVQAGNTTFLMFDDSIADDSSVSSATAAAVGPIYQSQITAALASLPASANVIFVTHKPIYAIINNATNTANRNFAGGDATLQGVFENLGGVPAPIKLFLSGHDHEFQLMSLTNRLRYAPQMVIGNSGTLLDNPALTAPNLGVKQTFTPQVVGNVAGAAYSRTVSPSSASAIGAIQQTSDTAQYGFAVLDATANGYLANVYTLGSTKSGRCLISYTPLRNMVCAN